MCGVFRPWVKRPFDFNAKQLSGWIWRLCCLYKKVVFFGIFLCQWCCTVFCKVYKIFIFPSSSLNIDPSLSQYLCEVINIDYVTFFFTFYAHLFIFNWKKLCSWWRKFTFLYILWPQISEVTWGSFNWQNMIQCRGTFFTTKPRGFVADL